MNDYITTPRFALNSGLTFDAWINTTSTDSSTSYAGNAAQNIIGDSTGGVAIGWGIHNGKLRYNVYTHATGWETVDSTASVNDGKWHYVSVTHEQATGTIKLYIDGIQDGSGTYTYNGGANVDRIGAGYNNFDLFTGKLDEVAIYNRALTSGEIATLVSNTHQNTIGNQIGVYLSNTSGNEIGGGTTAERNIISGNTGSGISIGGNGVPKDAVAWWKADGTASDAVGSNTGTLAGGTTYGASLSGQSFKFDGVDDRVTLPDSVLRNYATGTVEMWINRDTMNRDEAFFARQSDGVNTVTSFNFGSSTDPMVAGDYVWFRMRGESGWTRSTSTVGAGIWTHVAGNWDGTNVKLYVNGLLEASVAYSGGTPDIAASASTIGGWFGDGLAFKSSFLGRIDDVAIYSRALNANEIASIYRNGGGTKGGNFVQGNFIGTDVSGTRNAGNSVSGVSIYHSSGNSIGGATAGHGNLISSNAYGITISTDGVSGVATGNLIQGNLIGTDLTGTLDLGNAGYGIDISRAHGNTIGGTTAAERNTISGNNVAGVILSTADSNTITGNYIGTTISGTAALANGTGVIVEYDSTGNTIGGTAASSGNVISGNTGDGILFRNGAGVSNNSVGWWKGESNPNDTVLTNNGTWSGTAAYTTGKVGNAFNFDGSSYVTLPNESAYDFAEQVFSVEGWFKTTTSGVASVIINKRGNNDSQWNVRVHSDGRLFADMDLANGTDVYSKFSANTVNDGAWHHFVVAYDTRVASEDLRMYLDGVEQTTVSTDNRGTQNYNTAGAGSVQIGARMAATATDFFTGQIDEVSILGRAITSEEARQLYLTNSTSKYGNKVYNNTIGRNAANSADLANGGEGIELNNASNNLIGGTGTNQPNIIRGNTSDGVAVTGTSNFNVIRANSIFANGGLAIDLNNDGLTVNDAAPDSDGGPNESQNFPVLDSVVVTNGNTTIYGSFTSKANTTYTLDFYSNSLADASTYGEGQTYLGSATVTTNGSGVATINTTLTGVAASGFVSGTATEQLGGANFAGTSEFALTSSALYTLSGTVFEDVNYGGGAGRNFATAAAAAPSFDIDVESATVELYDSAGNFLTSTTTDSSGAYSFSVDAGNYSVRIVNSTVLSNRSGATSALVGIQTYRTDASGGSATAVTDHVGGETPNEVDAAANNGSQTFTTLDNASGFDIQSVTSISVSSANISGLDFGFNFDTIVNTNDAGQGSLRQFILNSNALANTNLSQAGQTAGKEVSIFMIADGAAHAGLNTSYANLLTTSGANSGAAVIALASALPTISAADTTIDATTQTTLVGNTNSGMVGTGGTVGVDQLTLSTIARPEVVIDLNNTTLAITGNGVTLKGISAYDGESTNGAIHVTAAVTGAANRATISQNLIGVHADGTDTVSQRNRSQGVYAIGASAITNNYLAHSDHYGAYLGYLTNASFVGGVSGSYLFQNNEVFANGHASTGYPDAVGVSVTNASISGNLIHGQILNSLTPGGRGAGIEVIYGAQSNTIANNTVRDNAYAGIAFYGNANTTGFGAINNVIDRNIITGNVQGPGIFVTNSDNIGGNSVYGNQFTRNQISGNGGLGIDLTSDHVPAGAGANDGVTANDGALTTNFGNQSLDFPVITSAVLNGTTLTVTGYIGTAAGDTDFANATIELFKAAVDASGYGEGQTYLGSITGSVTNGNFTGSFTLPGGISLATGDTITSTATIAAYGTSEFGANGTLRSISGTVFEDKDGNLLVGAEAIGDSNNPGVNGVTVKLYKDGGDGAANGTDDVLVGTTTTASGGAYSFTIDTGTYWSIIDSKTIASSVALNGGATNADTWAEQTYGVTDALRGIGFQPVTGALYGGRNLETSDNAATLAGSEHVTRVIVSGSNVTNIDSGFSFTTITRTGDGDDDGSANRTVQGSLRQFIQNANAISGVQSSVFSFQTSDSNYSNTGGGEYTIRPTSALPTITDTIVLDATTQAGFVSSPIVELDGRSAGAGAVDGLTLGTGSSGSTIRGFAINRFSGDGVQVDSSNNTIVGNLIGLRAEASPAVGSAIGWWQGENNTNDSAGTYTATLNGGATYAAGKVGQAFSLDGVNDYVNLGDSKSFDVSDFTLEAWVNLDAADLVATKQRIISRDDNATAGADGREIYSLYVDAGRVGAELMGTGVSVSIQSANILTVGWHHLAATRIGNTLRVYLNGTQVAAQSGLATVVISPETNLVLGTVDGNYAGEYFGGVIDDAAIYNRGLSATEIAANYAAGNAGQTVEKSPLVASFRMDGLTTDAIDGRSMTVNGATLTSSGRVGSAYTFDGVDDYIDVANTPELNPTNLTVAAWWYGESTSNGNAAIVSKGFTSHVEPYYQYHLGINGDLHGGGKQVIFQISVGGVRYNASYAAADAYVVGDWNHFSASYDGETMRVYRNGVEVATNTTPSGALDVYNTNVRIGGLTNVSNFTPGKIDEVNIFNRALTADEITDLYTTFAGTANVLGNGAAGVNVNFGSNNVIGGTTAADRNIVSNNVNGISVGTGVGETTIRGNYIGTDVTGALDFGNSQRGVYVTTPTGVVTIGGTASGAGNVISGNNTNGIDFYGGTGHVVAGNIIGLDASGANDLGNTQSGIRVNGGASITIGGTTTDARNIISGNDAYGVYVSGVVSGLTIQGNYIGTDSTGTLDRGNSNEGIFANAGTGLVIGGTTNTFGTEAGNVISGNNGNGISLLATGPTTVAGNIIGLNAAGTAALGNTANGINITSSGHIIGGTATGAGNLISGNSGSGIYVTINSVNTSILGNFIGTNLAGTSALGNANGITLTGTSTGTLIGGNAAGSRNIISGNTASGVAIIGGGPNNTIAGNYIGLGATGSAVGNQIGVQFDTTYGNLIGGADVGAANVISGNTGDGILLIRSTGIPAETVGWWKAENTASDAIGTNHGTLVGDATYADGKFGRAFSFDGTNDAVSLGASAANAAYSALTLEAWVNPTAHGSDGVYGKTIISKYDGGDGFAMRVHDGLLQVDLALTGGTVRQTFGSSALALNDWSHVVLTYNGSTIAAYVNGSLIGSAAASGTVKNTANAAIHLLIGNDGSGSGLEPGNFDFAGLIDEAAIYSRALTAAEVSAAYRNAGASKLGNRVEGNFIGTNAAGTAAIANGSDGVEINASSGQVIGGQTTAHRNIISGNTGDGVHLTGAATKHTQIVGNYIGTNAAGTAAVANNEGIFLASSTGASNTIGGLTSGQRNVISGNSTIGIYDFSSGQMIQGNYIGTNAAGTAAVANGTHGIYLRAASNNVIGGTAPGATNVISGNGAGGITIDLASSSNTVQGNIIGLNAAQSATIANSYGVYINGVNTNNNLVGGTATGAANVISGNTNRGIQVFNTNFGNAFLRNSIYANGNLGIDLGVDGYTLNDPLDGDLGANNLQNFPVIVSTVITGGQTIIAGTLNSEANKTYRIELFSNSAVDASLYGEGETYLGTVSVTTDINGNASFSYTHGSVLGGIISATATEDLGGGAFGSTSEFALTTSAIYTIGGTVFEDIHADGAGSEAIGHANNPVRSGVTVKLYADGGDGLANGTDDIYMTSTTTDGSGNYSFSVDNGTFWTVVDSKTVVSSTALNGGFTNADTWAEQTYGAVGSVLFDGSTYSYQTSTGATYGGQRVNRSDDAAALGTSEHVIRATVSNANVTGLDSGFSFQTVTSTFDGDDDGTANRTVQGSLRQFIQNANAISGSQLSAFKLQTSDSNYVTEPSAHWTIRVASALPDITQSIVLDATTQAGFTSTPVVELNGSLTSNGDGFRLTTGTSTVKGFAINGFRESGVEIADGTTHTISGNMLGTNAAGTLGFERAEVAGWWTGNGSPNDFSGTNHGTLNGATYATGKVGQAFSFDGVDDFVEVADHANLRPAILTISTWVNADTLSGDAAFVTKATTGWDQGYGLYYDAAGEVRFWINNYSVAGNRVSGSITAGQWHHLVATYDGSNLKLYVNGTLSGTTANASGITHSTNQLRLGRGPGGGSPFDGLMDDTAILNRAMSASEVLAVYQAGADGIKLGNLEGVKIGGSSTNNIIGTNADGTNDAAERNVISGNATGVLITGNATTGNIVAGNRIGTDVTGATSISNDYGVQLASAGSNTIGGSTASAQNQISGNDLNGVEVTGNGAETGMVGWWKGDNNANDVFGIANGTLLNGATYGTGVTGVANSAFSFDGNDDAVSMGSTTANGAYSQLSIDAWVNPTSFGVKKILVSKTDSDGFNLSVNNGNLRVDLRLTGGDVDYTFTGASLVTGQWSHVAFTYDGSLITAYINGVSVGSVAASGTIKNSANSGTSLMIGNEPNGTIVTPGFGFHESIDDVGIYSRSLTTAEIQEIYRAAGTGKAGNTISGNLIGTNAAGTAALANSSHGVYVSGSAINMIGGSTAGERNVISGNTLDGVRLEGANSKYNTVSGNYIGTNAAGSASLGGQDSGVAIVTSAASNTIGGLTSTTGSGLGNLISGNTLHGVHFANAGASNSVLGNLIGTNAAGTGAVANSFDGVMLSFSNGQIIGGTTATARNVISGNSEHGIVLNGLSSVTIQGNYIGLDINGTADLGNVQHGIADGGGNSGLTIGGTATGAGNVISGNNSDGITLPNNSTVLGNIIGLNKDGTAAIANSRYGISIAGSGSTIGGTATGARNVIAGNTSHGVYITGNSNTVLGNYVGTNLLAAAGIGNANGVLISSGSNNTIGGTATNAGNVISGNSQAGVRIAGSTATGNTLLGNLIGTNVDGTSAIANAGGGVLFSNLTYGNTIGGTANGSRNTISGNTGIGISLYDSNSNTIHGNYIGTNAAGTAALANSTTGITVIGANNTIGGTVANAGNTISGNSSDAIVLGGSGAFTAGNGAPSGVVSWWKADSSNSTGAAIDVLGANDGTLQNGATYATGKSGTAFSFDGVNDYVAIANESNFDFLNATGTVTGWFKTSTAGSFQYLVDKGNAGGYQYSVYIEDNNKLRAGMWNSVGGSLYMKSSTATVTDGVWHHFAMTLDSNAATEDVKLYLDGVEQTTVSGDTRATQNYPTSSSAELRIGSTSENIYHFGGQIDEVGVFNRSLTAAEISAMYNSGGVSLSGSGGNTVQGNRIGIAASTSAAIANGGTGVYVASAGNVIGGTAANSANIIANSGGDGVWIDGTTANGNVANSILGNSIYSNGSTTTTLGIDLGSNGVLANDSGDGDVGSNFGQNYPVITSTAVSGGNTIIGGTLNSQANSTFRVELFANTAADTSGYGEGRTYLGAVNVTTDGSGNGSFSYTHAGVLSGFISATSTEDFGSGLFGSTSEFP